MYHRNRASLDMEMAIKRRLAALSLKALDLEMKN
jgi:hypothetical protein